MDEETLQFYRGNAEAYAGREITSRQARLTAFLALLAAGRCHSRTRMRRRRRHRGNAGAGFRRPRQPTDRRKWLRSPRGVSAAPVETLLFHDLDEVEAYDGVWANACLLHVPRDELADILALIWRALKAGGRLLRQLQDRRRRRPRHAQSLLQLSVAGLAARHLCRGGQMEFAVDHERRSQEASTTKWLRCCSSWRAKASELSAVTPP